MIFILYLAAGYWAVGKTLWANRVIIEFKLGAAFIQRLVLGACFGWALIPIALIKVIFFRR